MSRALGSRQWVTWDSWPSTRVPRTLCLANFLLFWRLGWPLGSDMCGFGENLGYISLLWLRGVWCTLIFHQTTCLGGACSLAYRGVVSHEVSLWGHSYYRCWESHVEILWTEERELRHCLACANFPYKKIFLENKLYSETKKTGPCVNFVS